MKELGKNHRMAARLASGVVGASILMGGIAIATPALAAGSVKLHAASDYSSASTATTNGTIGRSYAQHGNRVAGWTAWTLNSSSAYADSGTSASYAAAAQLRY